MKHFFIGLGILLTIPIWFSVTALVAVAMLLHDVGELAWEMLSDLVANKRDG